MDDKWNLLVCAELKHASISFFDNEHDENAVSRWSRAKVRVAKLGKGLSKNDKAQTLALHHWQEAIDPSHRYGHNLNLYYVKWLQSQSREPFFYWLDIGEGKEVNLDKCSRSKLHQQCIKYLGPDRFVQKEKVVGEEGFEPSTPWSVGVGFIVTCSNPLSFDHLRTLVGDQGCFPLDEEADPSSYISLADMDPCYLEIERLAYEVDIDENGKLFYKQSGELVDTTTDAKWIFVLSTLNRLYIGKKKRGTFQHSSLLAGGATSAAGRLIVRNGNLKAVWPESGHYRPTPKNFQDFISFLVDKNVDLSDVKVSKNFPNTIYNHSYTSS